MSQLAKKIVLIKSKCDFNIDGMKLFRFHVSSCANCFCVNELPDTPEKCLNFIFCSTGKIRIQLLNGQSIYARQQEIVCVSEKVCISLSETEERITWILYRCAI